MDWLDTRQSLHLEQALAGTIVGAVCSTIENLVLRDLTLCMKEEKEER